MKLSYIFRYLFLVLVLYLYLFNPYPFRGGVIKLLYPFVFYACLNKLGRMEINRSLSIIACLFMLFIFDLFVLATGGDSSYVNSLQNIIELSFVPIGIGLLYDKFFPQGDFLRDIIIVCSIAGAISIILALNPDIAVMSRQLFNKNYENYEFSLRRLFGISQFLLFTYSVLLGFVAGCCLFAKGFLKLLAIPILMGVLLNARIGFASFLVVIVSTLLLSHKGKRNLWGIIFFGIIAFFAYNWLQDTFPETIEWVTSGYEETSEAFEGNRTGTFQALHDMAVLPSGLFEWIIGSGRYIFRDNTNNSDIGYFLQLNYGGIMYMGLLIYTFAMVLKKIKKNGSGKPLVVSIALVLLIANYKGNVLTSNEFVRFIFLFAFVYSIRERIVRLKTPVRV